MSEDELYKIKYLKYKSKYLQLKEELEGGGLGENNGITHYFIIADESRINVLKAMNKKPRRIDSYHTIMNQIGISFYEGNKQFSEIKKALIGNIMAKGAKGVAAGVLAVGDTAVMGTGSVIGAVGDLAKIAVAVGTAGVLDYTDGPALFEEMAINPGMADSIEFVNKLEPHDKLKIPSKDTTIILSDLNKLKIKDISKNYKVIYDKLKPLTKNICDEYEKEFKQRKIMPNSDPKRNIVPKCGIYYLQIVVARFSNPEITEISELKEDGTTNIIYKKQKQ